jgi:DeoR family transcriptional regulator of aga operon
MTEKAGKQDARIAAILQTLRRVGSVSVDELCRDFDVSVATIRRDLQHLEEGGLLRRTHGGAVPLEPLFYEPFKMDRSFQEQVSSFPEEKRRIAQAAAMLLKDGDVFSLTAGTTTTEIARSLAPGHHFTLVTNTVNVAMELSKRREINIYVTGGHLRGDWFSLVGATAIEAAQKVVVNTMFIGVNGLDPSHGLTCYNSDEAEINKAMLRQAKSKVVVADHSKFGVVANWLICQTSQVDMIITDVGASDEDVKAFQLRGVEVRRV